MHDLLAPQPTHSGVAFVRGIHSADPPSFMFVLSGVPNLKVNNSQALNPHHRQELHFSPPPHPKVNPTHVGGFWMWKGGMYAGHRRWTSRSISDVASLDCGRWFPLTLHVSPYSQPVAPEGELWGCSKVLPCGLLHMSSLALWSSRIAETVRSRSSSPHGRRLRDRRVDDARQLGRASILSNAYRGSLLQGPFTPASLPGASTEIRLPGSPPVRCPARCRFYIRFHVVRGTCPPLRPGSMSRGKKKPPETVRTASPRATLN